MKKYRAFVFINTVVIFLALMLSLLLYNKNIIIAVSEPEYYSKEEPTDYGCLITFFDDEGNEFITDAGYSAVHRKFDGLGRPLIDMYYIGDSQVKSSYDQFGVQYQYDINGRQSIIIFLNKKQIPMNGINGFSSIHRTFYPDGKVRDETFYDVDGNRVTILKGYYGIRHLGNSTIYIDKSGKAILSIDLILQQHEFLVPIIGFILVVVTALINRKNIFLVLYWLFILYETLVRGGRTFSSQLEFFESYRQFFTNYSLRLEILNNIWLFIPLGAGIRSLLRKPYFLFIPLLLSITIEAAQYFFGLGLCELDDIFSNTLGGCIGFLMAYDLETIISWIRGKREKDLSMKGPSITG